MIKFLHLLSVIVFCTINLIECSNSIQDELRNYYDSSVQQQFKEEWQKYRNAFETEIASGLRQNFGTRAVNIYEPEKHNAHLIARGFHLSDGVVLVYFNKMVLRELPALLRPKLNMELPSNFMNFESKLGRIFIDTTYYVARNSSSIIYARPEDQRTLSPFSLQQVDTFGKVVIVVQDCVLSGISVATLSGDSVSLGHSPFLLTDCKFMVEISTPNSGAPPVIAPYFPPGARDTLQMIIARPIREELQTKLQGAMYSYINTSVLFGNKAADFRNNQQKLFKSYAEFMTDYVAKMNQNTIKTNKAHVHLPGYEVAMNTETDKRKQQCHVGLEDIILYGLDTAYATRAGGPYNNGSAQTAVDAVIFSSMQIRGKITHDDKNGSSTKNFAADLTDVTVVIAIVINEDKTELQPIHFTGWRSLEFSIIPRETSATGRHDHQSLVYGHILNELPVRVLNHVTDTLGHKPNDENGGASDGNNGGGGNGSGDDNGGSNGGSGGGNGGGDDNGGSNGGKSGEAGANEDKSGGEDVNKTKNKTEGFFSDDILSDDNFFSDDILDDNFVDKNFFNDSQEILNKNYFFSDVSGFGEDFGGKEQSDASKVEGNNGNNKDHIESADDSYNVPGVGEDEKNTEGEKEKVLIGNKGKENPIDSAENGNEVPDVKDDIGGQVNVHEGSIGNFKEEKSAGGAVDSYFSDNKPFFSDDFIEKDFVSDDGFDEGFGNKKQGHDTGKVEGYNGNNKDQIESADEGYNVPGISTGNGDMDEAEKNTEGKKEEVVIGNNGKENPVDNVENSNEVPDVKTDGGEQMHEGSHDSLEENSTGGAVNSNFSDEKKSLFSEEGVDGNNGNDNNNIDIGKKQLWVFASQEDMKSGAEFLIENNYKIKSTSKENVTESVEDSREGKKVVLPSNVHNARRHQNMHTSENEIR